MLFECQMLKKEKDQSNVYLNQYLINILSYICLILTESSRLAAVHL